MRNGFKKLAVLFGFSLCSFTLFACNGEKTYTIKWVDQDGNVLETDENVKPGTIPEFNSQIPTKVSDESYEYNFRSWYPVVLPAAGDVTYVTDYTPIRIVKDPEGGIKENWYESTIEWVMQNKNKFLFSVPGGGVICTVFNKLFNAVGVDTLNSKDPFTDIKDTISELEESVQEGFSNVEQLISQETTWLSEQIKAEINQAERNLETTVLAQTTIANKGDSFDSLLTAMKSAERSLDAIREDQTLSKQDKALAVARLIGSYDKWSESSNLFASYLSFLDAVTTSTYSTTYDKSLFDWVYDQQMLHSNFSTEAIGRGAAYVERIVYLAFYAYSICQECISAAATVANFTADDLNSLSDSNKQIYASIVSPFSVIAKQLYYLNSKLCELDFKDVSVMDRVTEFFDYSKRGGIVLHCQQGDQGIKLSDELLKASFDSNVYNDGYAAVGALSEFIGESAIYEYTDAIALVNHVKQYYKDTTLRDYFTMLGYDMTTVANGTYFMLYLDYDTNFSYARYMGVNIDDNTCTIQTVKVKEGQDRLTSSAIIFVNA